MSYVTDTKIYGTFIEELIGLIFSSVKLLFSAFVCELVLYLRLYVTKSIYFSYCVLFKLHMPDESE